MKKLTTEQAIILTGFTGILHCLFSHFHADAEKRLGRPIWTHQFADKALREELANAYRSDFLAMMPEGTPLP